MGGERQAIPEEAMAHASGLDGSQLVGKTIVAHFEIDGTDRAEELFLCDDGTSFAVSCDPGYADDVAMSRTPDRWEVCLYDTTQTDAGRQAIELHRGRES